MNVHTVFILLCATSASCAAWPGREDGETQSGLFKRFLASSSPPWFGVGVFPRDQTESDTLTIEFQIDSPTSSTMIEIMEIFAGINTQASTGAVSSSTLISEVPTGQSEFPSPGSTVMPILVSTTSSPSVVSITTITTDTISSQAPSPTMNSISPFTGAPSCVALIVTVTVTTTVTKNAAGVGSSSAVASAFSSSSDFPFRSSTSPQSSRLISLGSTKALTTTVTSTTRTTVGSSACQTVQPPAGQGHNWANITSNWTSWCSSNGTGGNAPWNFGSYNSSGGMWNISFFNSSGGTFPWNVSAFNASVGPLQNYSSGLSFPTVGTLSFVNGASMSLGAKSTWLGSVILLVLPLIMSA